MEQRTHIEKMLPGVNGELTVGNKGELAAKRMLNCMKFIGFFAVE